MAANCRYRLEMSGRAEIGRREGVLRIYYLDLLTRNRVDDEKDFIYLDRCFRFFDPSVSGSTVSNSLIGCQAVPDRALFRRSNDDLAAS